MNTVNKIVAYPIYSIVGAGAGFLAATKLFHSSNIYVKIGASLAGALVGSLVGAKMSESKTAAAVTVKK